MDETEMLLKELTEASGIPGHEAEVRRLIRRHFELLGDVSHDRLGSLICKKGSEVAEPKVMLAAHMDEIGFVVSHITNEGFIKFAPLGGWWDHVLLAQRVMIKTAGGDVVGMIGAKPPHFLSDEERRKLMEMKDMYIDIGATSREEVEKGGVRVADQPAGAGGERRGSGQRVEPAGREVAFTAREGAPERLVLDRGALREPDEGAALLAHPPGGAHVAHLRHRGGRGTIQPLGRHLHAHAD